MLCLPAGATLRKLRLRGAGVDTLRARQDLERALQQVNWSAPSLPAESILLLRQLSVASAANGQRWSQRVEQALQEQCARARRPWVQADAASAAAVLFSDQTEMLACLVRDWLAGRVAQHWWWRSVLGAAEPAHWLRQQVLECGEVLVPVAMRLAAGARAGAAAPQPASTALAVEAWFGRLDAVQAAQALAAVERAFALPLPASPAERQLREPVATSAQAAPHEPRLPTLSLADWSVLMQLHTLVPELRSTPLQGPGCRLFATVMGLLRAPSQARTPAFTRAVWMLDDAPVAEAPQAPSTGISRSPVIAAPAAEAASPRAAGLAAAARTGRRKRRLVAPDRLPTTDAVADAYADTDANAATGCGAAVIPPSTRPGVATGDALVAKSAAASRESSVAVSPQQAVVLSAPRSVQTDFGGLFYLLNAALALGLYADFSAPHTPGLALSPWDWLAWFGRAWFGPDLENDDLWPLLAALAGRPSSHAPAADFAAPADWTVEPAWLTPWGQQPAVDVLATRSRLRLWHGSGFLLADVARDRTVSPRPQARALCARFELLREARLFRRLQAPSPAGPNRRRSGPTQRWLHALLAYLQARLGLALGLDDSSQAPALLCRHAARIHVDESAVRVDLSLNTLPLAIRLAGLDRDAGWIPAAGRSLRFRFT